MSPGNLPLPSGGGSWDSSGAVMSPFAPDMNSIASGSFMQGYGNPNSNGGNGGPPMSSSNPTNGNNNMGRTNSFDFSTDLLGGPLSQLADSVNSLDPLSSIEKTINEQVGGGSSSSNSNNNCPGGNPNNQTMPAPPSRDSGGCGSQHQNPHTPQTGPNTPHTPHTPGQALTPAGGNGPPSVGHPGNNCGNPDLIPDTTSDLPSDLNFDPEAVINGEGNESLNVSQQDNTQIICKRIDFLSWKLELIFLLWKIAVTSGVRR